MIIYLLILVKWASNIEQFVRNVFCDKLKALVIRLLLEAVFEDV